MLKYRIVQDNVILHDGLTQEEAHETLNILYSGMTEHYTVEEYNSPRVVGLGRDPDLH
jgi:hypothetical protein